MGQSWRLYNLDKQSYIDFSDCSIKLGEWFFSDDPTRLLTKLRNNGATDSWAGDRMICFGCYACSVPEGVMSSEEIAELKAKGDALELRYREIQHILKAVGSKDAVPVPEDFDYSTYVVRNLTKKMYIRGNDTPVGIPDFVRNSFGRMLFQNVCWSDDPSSSMTSADDIIQGEWAGDRFDVVKFKSVKDELSKDGWVDCTEELKERVEWLYVANGFLDPDERSAAKESSDMEEFEYSESQIVE